MAMPLGHFLQDIVEPNIEEFLADPGSIRKGFNAVAAVDAFAAHILTERLKVGADPFEELGAGSMGKRDDTGFRAVLADMSDEFRLIRDLAKANKHAFLTRGQPKVNGSGDTVAVDVKYGEGGYGVGAFNGEARLIVRTQDETEFCVSDLVGVSKHFLCQTAVELGLALEL